MNQTFITKHFTLVLMCLSCFLYSCQRIENTVKSAENQQFTMNVNLSFDADIQTKVQGETEEKKVNNVQIFVFRSDERGTLDACASTGFSGNTVADNLEITCTIGSREVWAIVNFPEDLTKSTSITTKAELMDVTTDLKQYSSNKLLMIGNNPPASFTAGSHPVQVQVFNAFAQIQIASIKNDMQAAAYQGTDKFRINKIYLVNVPGKINIAQNLDPKSLPGTDWYAKMVEDNQSNLLSDTIGESLLAYQASYTTKHTFYSFPNPCVANDAQTWNPRACRLVIEAEYKAGGAWNKCYYPITLFDNGNQTGLAANTRYIVQLTIKRPGSTSPDKPVEFDTISGTITIAPWSEGKTYTEVI